MSLRTADEPALPYRSKTDLVIAHLREAIQNGTVAPGQRLVVDRLAAELGVSKVPVREAVTRLTGEGLVEWRPNIGPVIPSFTTDDVLETAMLRVAVEAVALEIAVPLHDDQSLSEMQGLLARMEREDEAFPELNVRFHASAIAPIPYRFMYANVESLLRRAQRFSPVSRVPGYRADAHAEHVAIHQAIRSGNTELVQQFNRDHVLTAANRLVARLDGRA